MAITKHDFLEEARAEAAHLTEGASKVLGSDDTVSERSYFLTKLDELLADVQDDQIIDAQHAKRILDHTSGRHYETVKDDEPVKGMEVGQSVRSFGQSLVHVLASAA